jgi:putative peptidoglycan lipid II flippase
MIRVGLASGGLGLALVVGVHFRAALEAPLGAGLGVLGAKEIAVLLLCLAGALLYPVLLFAFGGVTPAEARAAFRRRKGDVATPTPDLS